uniref:F-box associated domain-containing protein n=1 Tax=Aegilops tauschii TaxID=37682 RepID=M8CSD6_AEGTA
MTIYHGLIEMREAGKYVSIGARFYKDEPIGPRNKMVVEAMEMMVEAKGGRFVPTSALVPAHPGLPDWVAMDCRHGRALFAHLGITLDLIVLDPVTGHQHRVTSPYHYPITVSAAVLCAAQGCDHHGCQGGHFHLAFVSTDQVGTISAWLYSSETAEWSEFTSLYHSNALLQTFSVASVLVGDALYFNMGYIVECQLGTLRMSMFKKPIDGEGCLMTAEDGWLRFAAVVDVANLTLWSIETGPEGAIGWAKLRQWKQLLRARGSELVFKCLPSSSCWCMHFWIKEKAGLR